MLLTRSHSVTIIGKHLGEHDATLESSAHEHDKDIFMSEDNDMGAFLRSRRERLAPEDFGFERGRRRTPGLRREEVALRAGVSVTWYTWLEQGRGGSPSADTLDGLALALALSDAEREHLFHLALAHTTTAADLSWEITARLQKILDSFDACPAFIKNPLWDVIAWNRAATLVLTDYTALQPEDRNIMKLLFLESTMRSSDPEQWAHHARLVVESFRLETQRAGLTKEASRLVDELSARSTHFTNMWTHRDVRAHGEGSKSLDIVDLGVVVLDYASFTLDANPGLSMVVYTPHGSTDRTRLRALLKASC